MSTNALDARATSVPDFYSSLEYLVAPIPVPRNPEQSTGNYQSVNDANNGGSGSVGTAGNEVNNSLQKLTNLVYLLTERCSGDDQSRTTLTLMQAELAHLSVLVRKQVSTSVPERRSEHKSI